MQRNFNVFSRIGFLTFLGLTTCMIAGVAHAQAMPEEPSSLGFPQESAIQPLLPDDTQANAPAPVMQEVEAAPPPPEVDLRTAAPEGGVVAMPDLPEAAADEEIGEDVFFDAESLVPQSEIARKGAPSKVDPFLSPGSRLVVARQKHDSSSKEAQLVAADRAMKLGRYESALHIYDGLYASNKRDPNTLMGRAVALQRLGRDDEAISAYEELLDARPANVEAQVNMQGLLSRRYPAVARRNLLDLMQDNPGNVGIAAQLAVVEAQMGRYNDAIRYLGIAASIEPHNAGHVYNMAVIADRAGDKKQAVRYYEEALEVDTLYGSGRTIPRESVFARLAELR